MSRHLPREHPLRMRGPCRMTDKILLSAHLVIIHRALAMRLCCRHAVESKDKLQPSEFPSSSAVGVWGRGVDSKERNGFSPAGDESNGDEQRKKRCGQPAIRQVCEGLALDLDLWGAGGACVNELDDMKLSMLQVGDTRRGFVGWTKRNS